MFFSHNRKPVVCVNCGYQSNPSLVKVYKNLLDDCDSVGDDEPNQQSRKCINPFNLKLADCLNCSQPVDFYLQMDNCLLLLDAILIKTTFFRHIIHNCQPPKFLPVKLFIVYCFCETFKDWSSACNQKITQHHQFESIFYDIFFKSIISNGLFFITIYLMFTRETSMSNGKHFLSSLVITSFCKLYKLPVTLWPSEHQNLIDLLLEINLFASLIKCCSISSHGKISKPLIYLKLFIGNLIVWSIRTLIIHNDTILSPISY